MVGGWRFSSGYTGMAPAGAQRRREDGLNVPPVLISMGAKWGSSTSTALWAEYEYEYGGREGLAELVIR